MKIRRSGAALAAVGALCLVASGLALVPVAADDEPGSGLGMYNLAANAPVVQVREDYAQNYCSAAQSGTGACEGVLNESVSTLRNGPIGASFSSVGWPGGLLGNLGTLLIVSGSGNVPDSATVLNDPVMAQNTISGKDDTVTNSTVPGATMTATATPTLVAATSDIGSAQTSPIGSFGAISSASHTSLTGASSAEAVAHSEVQNLDLGGVLKIKRLTSDASATTNGRVAKAKGTTTVFGASVNGVPVTIDDHGVTVQSQNQPFPAQVTDGVNTALKNAGMTVWLSQPTGLTHGAKTTYTTGSLNVYWQQQAGMALSILIGGSTVTVNSSPGYGSSGGVVSDAPDTTGTGQYTGIDALPPSNTGTTGISAFTDGSAGGPVSSGSVPSAQTAGSPVTVPVATSLPLPHGLSPWYVVLALLGSGLLLAGLKRLPDRVLETPATACPQGDNA